MSDVARKANDFFNVLNMNKTLFPLSYIITAGSTYLDIDAYACCVAMAELLQLKGENAVAYSQAPYNYSVCESLMEKGQLTDSVPSEYSKENVGYIIVDVSDPEYIKDSVPIDKVVAVYDHHVGFEEYWKSRIGDNSHIEFIGAAATLIYREWKKSGLQYKMKRSTALLLIAAILDNTLNLTSTNTTQEDIDTLNELCEKEKLDEEWRDLYFSDVQKNVEADLKNALFNDTKLIRNNSVLPPRVAQLCVWDAESILSKLPEIRGFFAELNDRWMINIIDIKHRCSYFVCDDIKHQEKIERVFDISFNAGIAKTQQAYLRKEIIKKTKP